MQSVSHEGADVHRVIHRAERETPLMLEAADFSWMPPAIRRQGGPIPRLFGELYDEGAHLAPLRTEICALAGHLELHRHTVAKAAKALEAMGFLERETNRRPQVWHLHLRPRQRKTA